MRQIRTSGSEGGETAIKAVFPTPIMAAQSPVPSVPLRPLRLIRFLSLRLATVHCGAQRWNKSIGSPLP
jgi:hypothetical protein